MRPHTLADLSVVVTKPGTDSLMRRILQITPMRRAFARIVPRATLFQAAIAAVMLLPLVVIASYSNVWLGFDSPGEMTVFGPAGSAMLRGDLRSVYENAGLQAGPFELLPYGVGELLNPRGPAQWTAYFSVCTLVLVFLYLVGVLTPISLVRRKSRVYFAAAIGAAACLSQLLPWAFQVGHPAQVVIPMLWVMAALSARQRHFATVGVLIGLSAGWEVWGVLGVPVVFCVIRPDLVRAAWGGLATVAVIFGPFVASGNFHMFQYKWPVFGTSLAHAIWPTMKVFPWSFRLVEGVLVLGVGLAVALVTRRTVHGLWLVPLALLAAKLTLDPLFFGYYSIAPGMLLIAAAGIAFNSRSKALVGVTLLLALWLSLPSNSWLPMARSWSGAAFLLFVAAVCIPIWLEAKRRREFPATDKALPWK